MTKILVTGANGFVCSNIIDVLLERGWTVYAVDHTFDNPAIEAWSSDRVTFITGSVESLPPLDVDYLLHGAAITAGPEERHESPEDNFMANLAPALAMMRYAHANNIKRSIFVSSSAVYRATARGLVGEDYPPSPIGCYPVAKHTIEGLVETFRTLYDRDVLCIRLGNLYGPHEITRSSRPNTSLVQQIIRQALNGTIVVDDNRIPREWTFVRDVGSAVDALLRTSTLNYALYNVAAGDVISMHDIALAVQKAMPDRLINIDRWADSPPDTLTRLGMLDKSRLESDTQFAQWTALEAGIRHTVSFALKEMNRA